MKSKYMGKIKREGQGYGLRVELGGKLEQLNTLQPLQKGLFQDILLTKKDVCISMYITFYTRYIAGGVRG
jgi:hypothetical protein